MSEMASELEAFKVKQDASDPDLLAALAEAQATASEAAASGATSVTYATNVHPK